MYKKFYSYDDIVTFSEFTTEELKYTYEQLASRSYGIPYVLYPKWNEQLIILKNSLLDKKIPYIDFLLSNFIRYKTIDTFQFPIPYLNAINNNPLKEHLYQEWLLKHRLYLTDFSAYFFDTSLLNGAIRDNDLIKRSVKGFTKSNILRLARNNSLHMSSYAYYLGILRESINILMLPIVNEIHNYLVRTGLIEKMNCIYEKELK